MKRSEKECPISEADFFKEPIYNAWVNGWLDDFSEDHFLIRAINDNIGTFVGENNFIRNNVPMYPITQENFCDNILANFSQRIRAMIHYFGEDAIHGFFTNQLSAGKENYNEDQFFRALTEVSVLTFWCGRSKSAIYEPKINGRKNPEARFDCVNGVTVDVEVKTPGFNNNPLIQSFAIPTVLMTDAGRTKFFDFCNDHEIKGILPRVGKLKDFLNSAAEKFDSVDHISHMNLLYINWTFSEYPEYSFLEAASLLSNSINGILNHRKIGLSLGVNEEVYDKITAVIVYTESLNGLMFNEFKYVWTGGKHLHHFRCYALHGDWGLRETTGMSPDPNLDDFKLLVGRVGNVPSDIQVSLRDIVEGCMLI